MVYGLRYMISYVCVSVIPVRPPPPASCVAILAPAVVGCVSGCLLELRVAPSSSSSSSSCSFLESTVKGYKGCGPVRNAILMTHPCLAPSCRSRGWKVSTVSRIGCVWDKILVTGNGFGAAMWEKCAQSQGFRMFGLGCARGGDRRTENRDLIYLSIYSYI